MREDARGGRAGGRAGGLTDEADKAVEDGASLVARSSPLRRTDGWSESVGGRTKLADTSYIPSEKANARNKTMMAIRLFSLHWLCGTAVAVRYACWAERIAWFVAVWGAGVAKLANAEL